MLNAADHGWTKEMVNVFNNMDMVDVAKQSGGVWNPWVGDSGITQVGTGSTGGAGGTLPYVNAWWPNYYPYGHCAKLPQDSYLCDDGEVVIEGMRYYWDTEIGRWAVVLETPFPDPDEEDVREHVE